jgi:hypothetical protein
MSNLIFFFFLFFSLYDMTGKVIGKEAAEAFKKIKE